MTIHGGYAIILYNFDIYVTITIHGGYAIILYNFDIYVTITIHGGYAIILYCIASMYCNSNVDIEII
jgi:hypothetical protein